MWSAQIGVRACLRRTVFIHDVCEYKMEEKLIEEVRKYELLYNVQCRDYRDQRKRQETWKEIGEKINRNGKECRDAWTKLRNAYTNALKRRKITSGHTPKNIPKWTFEDEMCFLSRYIVPRASQSSFESQYESNVESQDNETIINMIDNIKTEEEENANEDTAANMSSNSVSGVTRDSNNAHDESISVRSFRSTPRARSKRSIRSPEPPSVQNNTFGDEIDLFFSSLAKTVKKLPQNEQVRLKMGISQLVFEAELRSTYHVPQPQVSRSSFSEASSRATMPLPSPGGTSPAHSHSNESKAFVQSPSAHQYFTHTEENSYSDESEVFTQSQCGRQYFPHTQEN